MKTFAEVHARLRPFWPKNLPRHAYTLDYIQQLMAFLGNPQDKLKVIHVAGTSGKTSTSYYAAALLKAAGKKVGLVASPHVYEINERVQMDMVPLAEPAFCADLEDFLQLVAKSGITATYFEVLVAFAYWEFARYGMEYVVIEVGMGGLDDATNVVTRPDKVCVITDIGMDHMTTLGNTLAEIADKKAGIIQLRNSVCCYRQGDEVMATISERAQQKQADLHVLDPADAQTQFADLPSFQQRNLGLARAAANAALRRNDEPLLNDAQVAAAARTYIPARMEMVQYKGRTIILDGAHNAQKLQALGESLRQKYPGKDIATIAGFAGNRNYRLDDAARVFSRFAHHVIAVNFQDSHDSRHRSEEAGDVADIFRNQGATSIEIASDLPTALDMLVARPEPVLLVSGSLYMLGEVGLLLRKNAL